MSELKAENEKLKIQLTEAEKTIAEQQEIIKELEQTFDLRLFDAINYTMGNYFDFLNPHPVKVNASYNGKREVFELNATDVVCIMSDVRMKSIFLKKAIENIEGIPRKTSKIIVNVNDLNLDELRAKIDSLSYHLIKISKSCVVNLAYYNLKNDYVEMNERAKAEKDCIKLKINTPFIENFKARKELLESIISIHKTLLHYKG